MSCRGAGGKGRSNVAAACGGAWFGKSRGEMALGITDQTVGCWREGSEGQAGS